MKTVITYPVLVLSFVLLTLAPEAVAQTKAQAVQALQGVNSLSQLQDLREAYPNWRIRMDRTPVADSVHVPAFGTASPGEIIEVQYTEWTPKYLLKVLEINSEELCKVKYIYLDGGTLSLTEIDSLRALIIERFKKGEDFEALVHEYNMDGNPNGDLGWFHQGMMVDDFDNAVRPRDKGEIFTVDVKDNAWYYVVYKNHANRMGKILIGIAVNYTD